MSGTHQESEARAPEISIGIPTRDAGADLRRLLDRVFAQETGAAL